MAKTALVVGGTGPTGPYILEGLIQRGYEPVILHRGTHEVPGVAEGIEHIHADPHFLETLQEAIGDRKFEIVIGMYGRLRYLVEALRGHTDRLITVGGTAYKSILSKPADEGDPRWDNHNLYKRIVETEQMLMKTHEDGWFNLSHFRYPNLYGPRQLAPREWSIIRRILDGRKKFIILDGGLTLESRAYVENAAYPVLLAVDKPKESSGQQYNVADEFTQSDKDRLLMTAEVMGAEVDMFNFPCAIGRPGWYWGVGRDLVWAIEGTAPPTDHQLLSVEKMKNELGYRDLVDFREAVRRTVEYYVENQPERGGEEERQIGDPFDYEAEDKFIAALRDFEDRCNKLEFGGISYAHPYAHPKTPEKTA